MFQVSCFVVFIMISASARSQAGKASQGNSVWGRGLGWGGVGAKLLVPDARRVGHRPRRIAASAQGRIWQP